MIAELSTQEACSGKYVSTARNKAINCCPHNFSSDRPIPNFFCFPESSKCALSDVAKKSKVNFRSILGKKTWAISG